MKPLVSEEQYEKTRRLVDEFSAPGGVGPRLQQKLLEKTEAEDNWVISIMKIIYLFSRVFISVLHM